MAVFSLPQCRILFGRRSACLFQKIFDPAADGLKNLLEAILNQL